MHASHLFAQISFEGHYEGASAFFAIGIFIAIVFTTLGLVLLPGLIVAALVRKRVEKILNHRVSTIVTQYEPPKNLLPAELSLLHDMRIKQSDVMATLFHLEQRKIIQITNQNNVEILDQTAYDALPEFEKIAVRTANGSSATPEFTPFTTQLQNGQTITINLPPRKGLLAFESAVRNSLIQKNIKMNSFQAAFALRVVVLVIIIGMLPLLTASIGGTYNNVPYEPWSAEAFISAVSFALLAGFFLLPAYIIFSIILINIWTKVAGRYWLNSKQARAFWPEIEGYRLYLKQVDASRIQFESISTHQDPVTQTLPYALAFEIETKWQDRLKNRTSAKA